MFFFQDQMGLLYVALGVLLVLGISVLYSQILLHRAQEKGLYPLKGPPDLNGIKTLVLNKEHFLAIRAYRELTSASLKEAKAFVEEMEKSIYGPPNSSA